MDAKVKEALIEHFQNIANENCEMVCCFANAVDEGKIDDAEAKELNDTMLLLVNALKELANKIAK